MYIHIYCGGEILTFLLVGLNAFADMSLEEYRRTYLGTKINPKKLQERVVGFPPQQDKPNKPVAAAASVDWRTKGYPIAILLCLCHRVLLQAFLRVPYSATLCFALITM